LAKNVTNQSTTNHAAIDSIEEVNNTWSSFRTANRSLANQSAALDTITADINNGTYSDSHHADANRTLRHMDDKTKALNDAANQSIRAVNNSNATPARKFMAYRTIASHRSAAKQRAKQSLRAYKLAVTQKRAANASPVKTRFGGGLLGGILIGAAIGTIIPLREARNVEEQLKLSRNVSYNRRAALLPIIIGIVLVVGGIALLAFIGGLDLLGVML
jgi:hypothetical protein